MKQRPWIQVTVDTTERDTALRLTRLAPNWAAHWVEAGTPTMVFNGIEIIREIAAVCDGKATVADFKPSAPIASIRSAGGLLPAGSS